MKNLLSPRIMESCVETFLQVSISSTVYIYIYNIVLLQVQRWQTIWMRRKSISVKPKLRVCEHCNWNLPEFMLTDGGLWETLMISLFLTLRGAGPGLRCWSKMLNNHGAARSPCTSLKTVVIADSLCNSVHWSIHGASTTMPRLCIVVLTTV